MKAAKNSLVASFFVIGMMATAYASVTEDALAIWLRADSGVETNALGQIVSWANGGTCGATFDVTPASGAASASLALSPEGLGGRPSVTFDGTDYLVSSSSGDAGYTSAGGTWFVVYKPTSAVVNNTALFGLSPSDTIRIGAFCINGTVMRGFFKDGLNVFQQLPMYVDAAQNWCLSCFTNSGTTYLAGFVKGGIGEAAKTQQAVSPASAPLKVGQMLSWTGIFSGEIAELRFYNRPLTAVERAKVDLEISARYGLDISWGFGVNATTLLAAHGEDVAVAGYAPGQGVGTEMATSASSGGMTFAFAETPSVESNSLVAVSHDGGEGAARTWWIGAEKGATPYAATLTFDATQCAGLAVPALVRRASAASVWKRVAADATPTVGGGVAFTLAAGWAVGEYRLMDRVQSALAIWLRADSGVETNALGQIVSWANGGTCGNVFDVAPASGAASASLVLSPEGLGGKPSVTFDGTDYLLSASGDAGYTSAGGTWFVVYKPTSAVVNNTALFGLSPSDTSRLGAFCINGKVMRGFFMGDYGSGQYQEPTMYSVAAQNCCLSCFTNSGTTYLTGFVKSGIGAAAKPQRSVSPSSAPLKVGQMLSWTGKFSGEIAELRFYNCPLTAAERAQVDLEISARYGLDISNGFGDSATALLAAHGEDVAAAGYAPGQGAGTEVVTFASSGGMTFSFAETPSADANSLVAIAHDSGPAAFADGGNVMERTWCILNAAGTRPCRISFAAGDGIGYRYSLLYRAPGASSYTTLSRNAVAEATEVSFSIDAAATGTYTLGRKPSGVILIVQ